MPADRPAVCTIGAVAIGRNEGERLIRCLQSLQPLAPRIVYVDSGSTDGSRERASELGAVVLELDTSQGFTAARARNAGWRELCRRYPKIQFVQFVDGDCELQENWIDVAATALRAESQWAVVCGRRRERYPEQSAYNLLCDMEWNTPTGPARSCGGDCLIRVAALQQVNGYRDNLIAGEEPELCVRLRGRGWKIERLDVEMTLHDAAMTRFGQWFKRAQRSGHAYAEGAALHGAPPERHFVRETRRIWWWALLWPAAVILASLWVTPWLLLGLLIYPVQLLRTARQRCTRFGEPWRACLLYGAACTVAKWPQLLGQIQYWLNRYRGRASQLVEYK